MPATFGSGLKVLIEEARRQNGDTRPEMLRLLARLYLAAPHHDVAEQSRFATLAIRLIEAVGPIAAAPVAGSLAARADLPRELALYLAKGPLALAGPVLRLSSVLEEDTLLELASGGSKDHLVALSVRRDVSPALAKRLAALIHGEEVPVPVASSREEPAAEAGAHGASFGEVTVEAVRVEDLPSIETPSAVAQADTAIPDIAVPDTLGAREAAALPDHVETAAPVVNPPVAPEVRPAALRADYLSASPEDRALIVQRLITLAPLPLAERVGVPGPDFTDALLDAAKSDEPALVAALLEQALGVSAENAARIVADESGQGLAVAARALGLSFAILSRVLFRLHPVTGRNAADMARLADMFDGLTNAGAQHLVASWRAAPKRAGARAGEEAPSMRDFALVRPATQTAQATDVTEKARS